jgi:hypothetical protein
VRGGPEDGARMAVPDGSAVLRIPLAPLLRATLNDDDNGDPTAAYRTLELPIRHDTTGRHYVLWPQGAS